MTKSRQYGDKSGSTSSIGPQINTHYYERKALIEVAKDMVFSPLASTKEMPKHFGKKIKQLHYLPLLDDRNVNDQGIDASGLSVQQGVTIQIFWNANGTIVAGQNVGDTVKGEGADAASALADAKVKALDVFKAMGLFDTDYATSKTNAEAKGFTVAESAAYPVSGNLYGSSKDVGTIVGKLPVLGEHGGFVNRVGFKRIEIEGTIDKFGFYDSYTQESLDFDTDAELEMHTHRELLRGANQISEDMLQIDLLNGAGTVMFAGDASDDSEISGEVGAVTGLTYELFDKLSTEMTSNRTPRQTKILSGSRMIDTRVISDGWIMFVAPEMKSSLRKLTDYMGDKALVEVKHYADQTNIMKGELGQIGDFRIVVAEEMKHYKGAGATVTNNAGYHETDGKYDIFPLLVVGNESFTTIGFNTDGKSSKFKVKNVKPGSTESYAQDPFGETGFTSIKWFYGTMILRPERIAVIKTVAPY